MFCLICGMNRAARGETLCKLCLSVLKVQTEVVVRALVSADAERRRRRMASKVPTTIGN